MNPMELDRFYSRSNIRVNFRSTTPGYGEVRGKLRLGDLKSKAPALYRTRTKP